MKEEPTKERWPELRSLLEQTGGRLLLACLPLAYKAKTGRTLRVRTDPSQVGEGIALSSALP